MTLTGVSDGFGYLSTGVTLQRTNFADIDGATSSDSFSFLTALAVSCERPATVVTISTAQLAAGRVGTAYSETLKAATSGSGPVKWSVTGSLPNGLALDTATGIISGTPTKAGKFDFTVTATDEDGSVSAALSITIVSADSPIPTPTPSTHGGSGGCNAGFAALALLAFAPLALRKKV